MITGSNDKTGIRNLGNSCFANAGLQLLERIPGVENLKSKSKELTTLIKNLKETKQPIIMDPQYGQCYTGGQDEVTVLLDLVHLQPENPLITVTHNEKNTTYLSKHGKSDKESISGDELNNYYRLFKIERQMNSVQKCIEYNLQKKCENVEWNLFEEDKAKKDAGIKQIVTVQRCSQNIIKNTGPYLFLQVSQVGTDTIEAMTSHYFTINEIIEIQSDSFELLGVALHSGMELNKTPNDYAKRVGGHYIAIKKANDGKWYIFNDDKVSKPFQTFYNAWTSYEYKISDFQPVLLLYKKLHTEKKAPVKKELTTSYFTRSEIESMVRSGAYLQCYNLIKQVIEEYPIEDKSENIGFINKKATEMFRAIKCFIQNDNSKWDSFKKLGSAAMKTKADEYERELIDTIYKNGGLIDKKGRNYFTRSEIESMVRSGAYLQCYNVIKKVIEEYPIEDKSENIGFINKKATEMFRAIKCFIQNDNSKWDSFKKLGSAAMKPKADEYERELIDTIYKNGGLISPKSQSEKEKQEEVEREKRRLERVQKEEERKKQERVEALHERLKQHNEKLLQEHVEREKKEQSIPSPPLVSKQFENVKLIGMIYNPKYSETQYGNYLDSSDTLIIYNENFDQFLDKNDFSVGGGNGFLRQYRSDGNGGGVKKTFVYGIPTEIIPDNQTLESKHSSGKTYKDIIDQSIEQITTVILTREIKKVLWSIGMDGKIGTGIFKDKPNTKQIVNYITKSVKQNFAEKNIHFYDGPRVFPNVLQNNPSNHGTYFDIYAEHEKKQQKQEQKISIPDKLFGISIRYDLIDPDKQKILNITANYGFKTPPHVTIYEIWFNPEIYKCDYKEGNYNVPNDLRDIINHLYKNKLRGVKLEKEYPIKTYGRNNEFVAVPYTHSSKQKIKEFRETLLNMIKDALNYTNINMKHDENGNFIYYSENKVLFIIKSYDAHDTWEPHITIGKNMKIDDPRLNNTFISLPDQISFNKSSLNISCAMLPTPNTFKSPISGKGELSQTDISTQMIDGKMCVFVNGRSLNETQLSAREEKLLRKLKLNKD